jgi:hypothetical protein
VEGGGDVKSDTKSSSDKEVDIANFVDDEPSRGLERLVKMNRSIAESNEGEEINFEDQLTCRKATKKQASKEHAKAKFTTTKSTSPMKRKKLKAHVADRVSTTKTT